jgi:hypothetical protein
MKQIHKNTKKQVQMQENYDNLKHVYVACLFLKDVWWYWDATKESRPYSKCLAIKLISNTAVFLLHVVTEVWKCVMKTWQSGNKCQKLGEKTEILCSNVSKLENLQ